MIPLRLTLKNFLCYGDSVPVLDLEGVHVACLCGPNGHGKSALLDAMTWALWGKARGRSQEELIHYGHDEMLVDLEFLARETRYRATRRYSIGSGRRRQGTSDLQFQVSTEAGFHTITGNSIRDTQVKIDQVTGMDYDTFINSAFLMQGRADEFTNKTPGERKEVLAKILGLGLYDQLQDRVKGSADEKRVSASILEGDLERMRLEVSRKDGYNTDLEGVNKALTDINGRLESSRQALDALKMRVDDLRHKLGELEELKARIPQIEEDISDHERELETRRDRIAGYEGLVRDKDAIQDGLAQLQQFRHRYDELNRSQARFEPLKSRKSDLELKEGNARVRLEEQAVQLERHIGLDLRPKAEAAPNIGEKLDEARSRLGELAGEEQEIAGRREDLHGLATRMGQLEASAQALKSEGQELRSKLKMVENSQQGTRCPLCGSELASEGCQHLSESYNDQIQEKLRLYQENRSSLESAENEKVLLDKELSRSEAALARGHGEAREAVGSLERQMDESLKAVEEMERDTQELAKAKRQLEEGTFASEERDQLMELETQIAEVGYDAEEHRRMYDQMQELQPAEDRHRRLEEAVAGLPQEQESLARTQDMSRRQAEQLLASQARRHAIEADVLELPEREERLKGAEVTVGGLESRQRESIRRQVELEGELKKVGELERELDEKGEVLKALREEQGIFQQLTEAFGRTGVQAMLIETVLPSIEEEANALLGRMTDNRMHLKLETQRIRKSGKGEPIETLEIKISDEVGARSYELFSGGEAFRINLALRIALSKALAHRKGAPLPTLFIDEGFGTQDAAGRERILDVIGAIEGDFQRIIVITHLEELKEAFQTRIEVQKEGAGSTFWISY